MASPAGILEVDAERMFVKMCSAWLVADDDL